MRGSVFLEDSDLELMPNSTRYAVERCRTHGGKCVGGGGGVRKLVA